ncbi:MYND finger protein [Colletotrichum tabaci]|uniref:MYND finger protein n=1 Tax=Colletotrichum tabaci TaxID=1209068 RepID=A0AAV9TVU9_9PEZI
MEGFSSKAAPTASGQGEDAVELFSPVQRVFSNEQQRDDGNSVEIGFLDAAAIRTNNQQRQGRDVFRFTLHAPGVSLFPLTDLVTFITYLLVPSKPAFAIGRFVRAYRMASNGLYDLNKKSFFPSTDKDHLLRLIDVSGSKERRDPDILDEETQKNLRELDYILWQDGLPDYFDRATRYDKMRGDPVDRLFVALPSVLDDDWGFKDPEAAADHDRRFALALWPLANSCIESVIAASADKNAHEYWWAARFAFSLWERSDRSVRCVFAQLLGQLAVSQIAPIDRDQIDLAPGHKCPVSEDGEPCPGEAYINRNDWLKYARWIHRGRRDADADLEHRRDQASASGMGEALVRDNCVKCGIERGGTGEAHGKRMFYCHGCYSSFSPDLRRMYCSKKCQKDDWADHYDDCQRRKRFLRAVFLLKGVASKFMASTYSGMAVDCVGVQIRAVNQVQNRISDKVDRRGVPRMAVSPGVHNANYWVGQQVFPLGQSFLSHKSENDIGKVMAWDAGNNLYYHLQPIIQETIGPHCDMIVETEVYVRNANSITSLAANMCREGLQLQIAKGKDPMFWPHPVLNCRLKGSNPDDIYIIDLLGDKFGFKDIVLPFAAFIKSRHASCVSSTVLRGMPPHWFPAEQKGLVACRDTVSFTWAECIKTYFSIHHPTIKGAWQVPRLTEEKFHEKAAAVMAVSDRILQDITNRLREQDVFRQYLVIDPNPYSHEFGLGVTHNQEECDVYENIWMDRRTYDVIIKDELVARHKTLRAGSETLRLAALWVDRLRKHSQRGAPFDSAKILGGRAAKHFGVGASHSAGEFRKMERAWLTHSGIAPAHIDIFYKQCDRVFGDRPGSSLTQLRRMMEPEAASECIMRMSTEEAQIWVAIGAYLTSSNSKECMEKIRAHVASLLKSKN